MTIECITVDTPHGFIYLTSNETDVAKNQIMIFEPNAEAKAVLNKSSITTYCDHITLMNEKWVELYDYHGRLMTFLPIVARHGNSFP